ncbi:recombinase family protein [Clostridium senegalense]|uniref:recombinase family protein n=1 Tax=Clostridium senegalense TaxID=1465809 RepID=UPI001C1197D8|nr:recombinase family protein [Clostridium senegalense]MBU5228154.1 recombinase family protein [Clostridium senegalense]
MKKNYGYARVSSKEQNLDRQIEALTNYGINERDIITDKQSGKDFNRTGYVTLKNQLLRSGDTLVIKELDRLGRNMDMIKKEWQELQENRINIIVLDTPLLNTEGKSDLEKKLISNIVFELLSYMAEKERIKIKERQAEGIKKAKEKGKHLGRPKAKYPKLWEMYYFQWKSGQITAKECMEQLDLKRTTFYKLAKDYESKLIK